MTGIKVLAQEGFTEYYKHCENFNYPIDAQFKGPLKEEQLGQIMGRHFKVEYEYNSRTKAYRIRSISHFYLGQPKAIYEYQKTKFTGQEITYSNVHKIEFKYNSKDFLTEIRLKDVAKNHALILTVQVNKYEKGTDGGFGTKISLDENEQYQERSIHKNNLKFF